MSLNFHDSSPATNNCHIGPKVVHQVPDGAIVPSPTAPSQPLFLTFSDVSFFVIPRQELCGNLLQVCTNGYRILGYPICMKSARYDRNEFIFNFCVVLAEEDDFSTYKSVVQKLADLMHGLEEQNGFLSRDFSKSGEGKIHSLCEMLMEDLNNYCECMIPIGMFMSCSMRLSISLTISLDDLNTLNIKLFPIYPSPPHVKAWQVPLFMLRYQAFTDENWDLTMQRVCEALYRPNFIKTRYLNIPDRTTHKRRQQRPHHLHSSRHRLLPHLPRTPPSPLLWLSIPPRHILLLCHIRTNSPIQLNNSLRRSNATRVRTLRQPPLRTTPTNRPITPNISNPKHKREQQYRQHSASLNLPHRPNTQSHARRIPLRRRRNLASPRPRRKHIPHTKRHINNNPPQTGDSRWRRPGRALRRPQTRPEHQTMVRAAQPLTYEHRHPPFYYFRRYKRIFISSPQVRLCKGTVCAAAALVFIYADEGVIARDNGDEYAVCCF